MNSTDDSPSIINKIMDLDFDDDIAVKDIMDIIIGHPNSATFFLGSLLGTSKHQNAELTKSIFLYHDAWTPHDLFAFIFGIEGGPHFLVNIFEPFRYSRHDIPFDRYAKRINGKRVNEEDIYVPPLQYKDIKNFVRIDVFSDNSFKIRNLVMSSEINKAYGRFLTVENIDIDEMVMSLHRRVEGYKIIDLPTDSDDVLVECEDLDELVPYDVDVKDTFENKILNFFYQLQKKIKTIGDLSTFVKCMLPGLKVYHPYDENEHIVAVQSPVDGILFMIVFDLTSRAWIWERKRDVKVSMRNLLTHYIPDYISNYNRRVATLLAITYNITVVPHSDDTIISLMHSSESSEVSNAVDFYINNITLMDRCRHVILKNRCLLRNHISEMPQTLQNFIHTSKRSNELIAYRMDDV